MKFLGAPLEIPGALTGMQAAQREYVDALGERVTDLENSGVGGGGSSLTATAANGDVTATAGQFILADATTAALTVTLPLDPAVDTLVAVKKVDTTTNLVTVTADGGAVIDGDPAVFLPAPQSAATFLYDGASWRVSAVVVYDTGTVPMFTYRGDYDDTTGYLLNDVVSYLGNSYVARMATTGNEPPVDATDATWGLLALHGAPGDTGTTGPSGGISRTVPVTGDATAAAGDLVLADATAAALTVTLPTALPTGTQIAVRKTDTTANTVTVTGSSGDLIEGDADAVITAVNLGAVFMYDGDNWLILQYLGV